MHGRRGDSALVAILTGDKEGPAMLDALLDEPISRISAGTLLEAALVLDSRSIPEQRRRLDDLLRLTGIQVVAFDAEQAAIARAAHQDFGSGSSHRAKLNFGDCSRTRWRASPANGSSTRVTISRRPG